VSFQSTTTVSNGPVIIYVTAGSVDPGCGTINSGGTAVNFQLYVTPSETWTWNGSCRTDITGGVYAPHRGCLCPRASVELWNEGAVERTLDPTPPERSWPPQLTLHTTTFSPNKRHVDRPR
jgi:hypothetical protein